MGIRYLKSTLTKTPSFEELVDIVADILIFVGKQKGSVVYLNGRKIRNGLGIEASTVALAVLFHVLNKLGFQIIETRNYKLIVIPTKNKLSQFGLTHGKDALKAELKTLL